MRLAALDAAVVVEDLRFPPGDPDGAKHVFRLPLVLLKTHLKHILTTGRERLILVPNGNTEVSSGLIEGLQQFR